MGGGGGSSSSSSEGVVVGVVDGSTRGYKGFNTIIIIWVNTSSPSATKGLSE